MMSDRRTQVDRELSLIPRGSAAQNEFRMVFNARRRNALGATPEGHTDLRSVFAASLASVRATYPTFEPDYDPRLFESG
jgi:hypothetical protein